MLSSSVLRFTASRVPGMAASAGAPSRQMTAAFLQARNIVRVPLSGSTSSLATTPARVWQDKAAAFARSQVSGVLRRALGGRTAHLQCVPSSLVLRGNNSAAVSVRCFCATPNTNKKEAAAASGDGSEGVEESKTENEEAERPMRILDAEEEEVSRPKAIATLMFQFTLFAGALYLLYQTIRILMPTKMSTVTFFNRCSDVVRADPEIVSRFGGEVKSYGADHNTRRQGRRFRIPEYRYTKDKVDYLRIVFNIEGPSGSKGKVYAEIRSDQKDKFHYLIVEKAHPREIITIHDNRSPVKPKHVRQADTAIALQALRATLYGSDVEEETVMQKKELGEHINLIRYIKCDENPYECTSNGVTKWPSWTIDGKLHEGFMELEQLEKITEDLKHRTMVTA